MSKPRIGLQKQISSIFNGIQVPGNEDTPSPDVSPANDDSASNNTQTGPLAQDNKQNSTLATIGQPTAPIDELIAEQEQSQSQQNSENTVVQETQPQPQENIQPSSQVPQATVIQPASIQPASKKQLPPKMQAKLNTIKKLLNKLPWQKVWQPIQEKFLAPQPGVNPVKQKVMLVLVPVLFIALICVFINLFSDPAAKKANAAALAQKNAAAFTGEVDWQAPEPYPSTLRDPTKLGTTNASEPAAGSLVIRGILYSPDNSAAIIGTQIVHEGEEILGVRVVKITKNSVEFDLNGKTWTQKVQR